jgi:hypothetical protein
MATQDVPASVRFYNAAEELRAKGHFARAVEKFERAAAAAAQELAAEDCLVVAFLQASQARALIFHSMVPALPFAEKYETYRTVESLLLPQCVSTLTRRKAAGTLLPGSCRAAEVAWWRASVEQTHLQDGYPIALLRALAVGSDSRLGFDVYLLAARAVICELFDAKSFSKMSRELQLSHAAFVASAFELMAQRGPSFGLDTNNVKIDESAPEKLLSQIYRYERSRFQADDEAASLMADAWQLVERSGALTARNLLDELDPEASIDAGLAAAAAEGAVRGLRECALAGCASKEVHVSQFKRCGACRTVFYCCRDHQLADWPAHKAACKAARQQQAANS